MPKSRFVPPGARSRGIDGVHAIDRSVLQIIVAAVTLGAAAVRSGDAGASFLVFNAQALAVFRRVLYGVIALTRYGWQTLGSLARRPRAGRLDLVPRRDADPPRRPNGPK